jgi:hypothetical protein
MLDIIKEIPPGLPGERSVLCRALGSGALGRARGGLWVPAGAATCRLTKTCGFECGWGLSAARYHSEFREVLGYPYFNVSTSEDLAYHTEYGSVSSAVRVMRRRRKCLPHHHVHASARSRWFSHSGPNCLSCRCA